MPRMFGDWLTSRFGQIRLEAAVELSAEIAAGRRRARWPRCLGYACPGPARFVVTLAALMGLFLGSCAEDGTNSATGGVMEQAMSATPGLAGESLGNQAPVATDGEPGMVGQGEAMATAERSAGARGLETAVPVSAATPTVVTPPAPLAAMVNGEYLFLDEYERRVALFESGLLEGGLDPASERGQADMARIRGEILEEMIDQALIEQGSAALDVVVTDEQLAAQIEVDVAAGQGETAFDQWLQATGQSRDDYQRMVREALLIQRLLESMAAKLPAEMEQVHVRCIVVDSDKAAQEIRDLVEQGSDFAELARDGSQDVATRDQGGDMGWFARGMMVPELERAAFTLNAGDLEVIRLGEEYHVLEVLERAAARPLSPEERIQLARVEFERWLHHMRQVADIERYVGE